MSTVPEGSIEDCLGPPLSEVGHKPAKKMPYRSRCSQTR